jgi:hypothetical protein
MVLLLQRDADRRGYFYFGLAAGLAYLFRTHYTMMLGLVPLALLLGGQSWREVGRSALAFAAGFAATAWPLWLLNTIAYGTPLHAGVSQYNIAFSVVPGALDWENYPETYDDWPLARVLQERSDELLQNIWRVGLHTFGSKLTLAGLGLGAVALTRASERWRRQLLAAVAILCVLYVGAVIVPTRFTERSYLPVGMLCSVLVGAGLSEVVQLASRPRWASALAAIGILFLTFPSGLYDSLHGRSYNARWNSRIVRRMQAAGMRSSDEVFSNVWAFYNMSDPLFVSFYNYGGWIELDSLWARERPHPTAKTVAEWQAFFAEHGIRFVVLRNRKAAAILFRKTPPSWKQLFSDSSLTVWAIDPPPGEPAPPPEAGATEAAPAVPIEASPAAPAGESAPNDR